jgi:hypothetical protein
MRPTRTNVIVAIGMLALGSAGLMHRKLIWCDIVVGISLLIFTLQWLSGFAASSTKRVARISFAVVGFGYLFVVFASSMSHFLITNQLLSIFWKWLDLSALDMTRPADYLFFLLDRNERPVGPSAENALSFLVIGHCVFSWMLAVLAAWFAGRVHHKAIVA